MKTYNVAAVQNAARIARTEMHGYNYIHFKGGEYLVTEVDVDENTGMLRVSYWSIDLLYRWSRTLVDFTETVQTADGPMPRFRRK